MPRYAIYAMPPTESALWQVGSSVLGYDAATGLDVAFPDHPIFADPLSLAWSAEPRRYGFHATLKAPFRMASGLTVEELEGEMERFAAPRAPIALDLTLAPVGHFLALVAVDAPAALQSLADDCVRHFDPFVLEDFQFHMTLTGSLEPNDRHRLEPVLRELLQTVPLALTIDALALFRQDEDEGRFVMHARYPFAG